MAKTYDIGRQFTADNILEMLKRVQKVAEKTDDIIGGIGKESSLDIFCKQLKLVESSLKELQRKGDSSLSGLSGTLKDMFGVNLEKPSEQFGSFLEKFIGTLERLNNIDFTGNTKEVKQQLVDVSKSFNDIFASIGINSDFKIDGRLGIDKIIEQIVGELNKFKNIKVSLGNIDTSAIDQEFKIIVDDIKSGGDNISDELEKQIAKVDKQIKQYEKVIEQLSDMQVPDIDVKKFQSDYEMEDWLRTEDSVLREQFNGLRKILGKFGEKSKEYRAALQNYIADSQKYLQTIEQNNGKQVIQNYLKDPDSQKNFSAIQTGHRASQNIALQLQKKYQATLDELITQKKSLEAQINQPSSNKSDSSTENKIKRENDLLEEQLKKKKQINQEDQPPDDKPKELTNPNLDNEEQNVEALKIKIEAIKTAVEEKTKAFVTEEETVNGVIERENAAIDTLIDKLGSVKTVISDIATDIKSLNDVDTNINLNGKSSDESFNDIDSSKSIRSQEEIQAEIDQTISLIKNQQDWLKSLKPYLDNTAYQTSNKTEAYENAKRQANKLVNYRTNPTSDSYRGLSYAEERFTISAAKSYQEAERMGVAESRLLRIRTDANDKLDESVQALQKEYDYRQQTLSQAEQKLQTLEKELELRTQINNQDQKQVKIQTKSETSSINNVDKNQSTLISSTGAYALESTLQTVYGTLQSINDNTDGLKNGLKIDAEKKDPNVENGLDIKGIGTISDNVKGIYDILNRDTGTVKQKEKEQKVKEFKKPDTSVISSRDTYEVAVQEAVSDIGTEIQIKSAKELGGEVKRIVGAVKDAQGVWQEFTIDVDKNNTAIVKGIDSQGSYAKALNKTAQEAEKVAKEAASSAFKDSAMYQEIGDIESKVKGVFNRVNSKENIIVAPDSDFGKIKEQYKDVISEINELKQAENEADQATQDRMKSLREKADELYKSLKKYEDASKPNYGQNNTAKNALSKNKKIMDDVSAGKSIQDPNIAAKLGQVSAAYDDVLQKQKEFINGEDLTSETGLEKKNAYDEAVKTLNTYGSELLKLSSEMSKFQTFDPVNSNIDFENVNNVKSVLIDYATGIAGAKVKLIDFNEVQRTASVEINRGHGVIEKMTVGFNQAGTAIGVLKKGTKEAQGIFKSLFGGMEGNIKKVLSYVASFGSFYQVINIIKQGIGYVKEIDSALTELKKVTDETDASYKNFLQDMSKTASIVGGTVSDLTRSAADWARLGLIERLSPIM